VCIVDPFVDALIANLTSGALSFLMSQAFVLIDTHSRKLFWFSVMFETSRSAEITLLTATGDDADINSGRRYVHSLVGDGKLHITQTIRRFGQPKHHVISQI
jgi:hypothetical protein